jgi:arginine repressor
MHKYTLSPQALTGAPRRCRSALRPDLATVLRESLLELRQAHNLLLLRTVRGRARRLAAAVEAEWSEVLCAVAAADLLVLVTPSSRASLRLRKILGEWMSK